MVHRSFAGMAVALVVLTSCSAQETAARPRGPAPRFFIVTAVNKDGLVIEPAPMPTKEVDPDKVEYKPAFKGLAATDRTGKKLTPDEVARRLKPGSVVLVNVDVKPVDPAYLAIVKDDAVILADIVPPHQGEPAEQEK